MKKKHVHCTPIWTIPNKAAAHANPEMSLQHPISRVLSGSVNMFAMLAVPDTMPNNKKSGERPREERRAMILRCCGR